MSESLPFNYVTGDGVETGLPELHIEMTRFTHAEGTCTSRGNGCSSTANGRKDCHVGSIFMNDCEFVKSNARTKELSRYDMRARSDYAPESMPVMLTPSLHSYVYKVIITNDQFLEVPDERINLRITSPGMQPSFGGPLWSVLTIENDGDGSKGAFKIQINGNVVNYVTILVVIIVKIIFQSSFFFLLSSL